MAEDMSDIINNLSNMIKEDKIPDNIKQMLNNVTSSNNSKDVSSSGSSNISPEMLSNLASMFSGSKNGDSSSNTSDSNSSSIDMDTILKMKSIMEKMNSKDDPRSNLLLSLKPYLKNSRKDKVEQYIKLFNMSKVIDVFNLTGGDTKK